MHLSPSLLLGFPKYGYSFFRSCSTVDIGLLLIYFNFFILLWLDNAKRSVLKPTDSFEPTVEAITFFILCILFSRISWFFKWFLFVKFLILFMYYSWVHWLVCTLSYITWLLSNHYFQFFFFFQFGHRPPFTWGQLLE